MCIRDRDIGLACECSHIGWIQDTICIAVCQDLIVGQIVAGRLLVKQFPRICHGVDAGDLKLFHRLKQRFKRTVKLCVTIPEDFELVMACLLYTSYDKKDIGRLVNVFFMLCVRPAAYRLGLFSCNHFWNLMHICSNIRE